MIHRRKSILNNIEKQAISTICFSSKTRAGKEELWKEIKKYLLEI